MKEEGFSLTNAGTNIIIREEHPNLKIYALVQSLPQPSEVKTLPAQSPPKGDTNEIREEVQQ